MTSADASPLGSLEVALVDGASSVVKRLARYPLRFLFTHSYGGVPWVYAINFGGGLVCGDSLSFNVRVGRGASLVITTQSSTKVYKSRYAYGENKSDRFSEQRLGAHVESDALLCVAPDPLTCFKGSRFKQLQRFDIEAGASLCIVDWVSCGRENGFSEVWDMEHYENSIQVWRDGAPLYLEDIVLENTDASESSIKRRMGNAKVFATVVLIGPRLDSHTKLQAQLPPTCGKGPVLISRARLLCDDGTVIRMFGPSVESVELVLRKMFRELPDLFGDALFAPK